MDNSHLLHFGKKGMKWGVRKEASLTPKLRGKEKRAAKKQFYTDKANRVVMDAINNPKNLYHVTTGPGVGTILTGKEFVEHLSRGGVMDVKSTDLYATAKEGSPYVINENMNERYRG